MKRAFQIFSLVISISSFVSTKRTLIENITIGKFSYSIYKEEKYIHDDHMNAEFFVVYNKSNKVDECSAFLKATRNDTLFIEGQYVHNQQWLEVKESHFYNILESDSTIARFYPDKKGKLILIKYIAFKKGSKMLDTHFQYFYCDLIVPLYSAISIPFIKI